MNETEAKTQLRKMLGSFTAGSVLHLLAEHFHDAAVEAKRVGDRLTYRRCKTLERALFVVGLGVDAANPS